MAEDGSSTPPEGGQTSENQQQDEFTPITSQEEFDKLFDKRWGREKAKYADYDDLKDKASQLDTLVEASKTDQQRLEERANGAEEKLSGLEAENMRLKVALSKGIPLEHIGRLQGKSQEELEADADALLGLMGTTQQATPDLRAAAGQRSVPAADNADDWLRRLAGRS